MIKSTNKDETLHAGTDLFAGPQSSGFRNIQIDDDTKKFLNRCRTVLGEYVGPIARVFIKEAVVGLSPNRLFMDSAIPQLITYLERQIYDDGERVAFRRRVTKLLDKPL